MMLKREHVVGVILAGGQARRMGGGDKCLLPLAGEPILAHVLRRLRPQCATVLLNANGNISRFAEFDVTVAHDVMIKALGPLGGILTGMEWAHTFMPNATHVVTVAADTPFFPCNLVSELSTAVTQEGRPIGIAASRSNGQLRDHPTFGIWPVDWSEGLRRALGSKGVRKILDWADEQGWGRVEFPSEPFDPFFNVNTPSDLEKAAELVGRQP